MWANLTEAQMFRIIYLLDVDWTLACYVKDRVLH